MALRGREHVLGALMYWRMYRMSFRRRSGTEVKTPRAMTSRSIRGEPQFDLVEPGRVSRREVQPDTIKRRAMGKMRAVQVAQGGGALAQFEAKFRDCARNALRPLSNESVDAVLSRVQQLDRVADVRDLLAPF